jgi:hypothetical protein
MVVTTGEPRTVDCNTTAIIAVGGTTTVNLQSEEKDATAPEPLNLQAWQTLLPPEQGPWEAKREPIILRAKEDTATWIELRRSGDLGSTPCRSLAKGEKCTFGACSFSHDRGTLDHPTTGGRARIDQSYDTRNNHLRIQERLRNPRINPQNQ